MNYPADEEPTKAALLTPPGRGAVATIVVEGPDALSIVESQFAPTGNRSIENWPLSKISVGRWGGANGEELVVQRAGEARFEIHCHGGAAAWRAILDGLGSAGCQIIDWQEWNTRQEPDPLVAEAINDLARAKTERTAGILLDQANGALRCAVDEIQELAEHGDWKTAEAEVCKILRWDRLAAHLVASWRIMLAGRPNVGKSSLMNALAGYQRAIVHPIAGTTRDVLTLDTAIDGWPVELSDTAGFRVSDDALETAGVEMAKVELVQADLVVLVFDASIEWTTDDDYLLTSYPDAITVLNKIDLEHDQAIGRTFDVLASAATGDGIDRLLSAIGDWICPEPPPLGAAVPYRLQHVACLTDVWAAVRRADADAARKAIDTLNMGANWPLQGESRP